MASNNYDFRKFQEELAALDRQSGKPPAAGPVDKKAQAAERMAKAREEFLLFRHRYGLTVADVVAFFPEEEGIAYLQGLIAAAETKPRGTRKKRQPKADGSPASVAADGEPAQ